MFHLCAPRSGSTAVCWRIVVKLSSTASRDNFCQPPRAALPPPDRAQCGSPMNIPSRLRRYHRNPKQMLCRFKPFFFCHVAAMQIKSRRTRSPANLNRAPTDDGQPGMIMLHFAIHQTRHAITSAKGRVTLQFDFQHSFSFVTTSLAHTNQPLQCVKIGTLIVIPTHFGEQKC